MLRKHFAMSGDNKPDFTITYHAPKHVPFFGGYAKNWVYGYPDYGSGAITSENPIKFKIIDDKWVDGVGEWKFRLDDSSNRIYNSAILGKKIDNSDDILTEIISAGFGQSDSYIKGVYDENDNIISHIIVENTNIITSVIFGEGINTINGSILSTDVGQSSCTEITLPKSVTQLTGYTFRGYKKLKSLTIPENVIRIDNLVSVYTNVTSSERNDGLEKIIMHPINPPDSSNAQYNNPLGEHNTNQLINPDFKIRVYADAIDNYKNDSIWGQYSDLYDTINDTIVYYTDGSRKLYIENQDITSINSGTLSQSITNVYLPNSVTEIGEWAFHGYSGLTSITIPNSVTSIGMWAFAYCNSLKKINIPDNIVIGQYCFDMTYFGKNNITGDYTKITENGGYVCDFETEDGYLITQHPEGDILEQIRPWIKNVIISDDIKYIGNSNSISFYGNNTIESIYIGKNVKGNRTVYPTNVADHTLDLSLGYSNNIKSLKVDSLNPYYDSRNDCNAVIETATNTLFIGCPTTTIPDTIEIIKYNNAFSRIRIETLNIPLSVNKIINMYRPDTHNYTWINTIIYEGTIEQWNAIEKSGSVYEDAAITIKCSDGEIKYFTYTNT